MTSRQEAPSSFRSLGRVRGLVGAIGVGALGSLAGCNSQPDAAGASGADTVDSDVSSSDSGGLDETTTPGSTGGSTTPTPTTTTGLSESECASQLPELESELESVRNQAAAVEAEIPRLRREASNLGEISTLFEPVPDDILEAAERIGVAARDAVVNLELGNGMASGWFIDDYHIITNAHNVFDHHGGTTRDATAWTVTGDTYDTTLVDFVDTLRPDVALLRTDRPAPATLTPGTTPPHSSRAYYVQVGHPGEVGNWVISIGKMVSGYESEAPDGEFIAELQTTIPGRQGVSGSPVLDLDGNVVGLTYAGNPIRAKQPDEAPLVAPDVVYDRPVAALSYGAHVGIDGVLRYYDRWTA